MDIMAFPIYNWTDIIGRVDITSLPMIIDQGANNNIPVFMDGTVQVLSIMSSKIIDGKRRGSTSAIHNPREIMDEEPIHNSREIIDGLPKIMNRDGAMYNPREIMDEEPIHNPREIIDGFPGRGNP